MYITTTPHPSGRALRKGVSCINFFTAGHVVSDQNKSNVFGLGESNGRLALHEVVAWVLIVSTFSSADFMDLLILG